MDLAKLIPLDNRFQIISAVERAAEYGGEVWQTGNHGRSLLQISSIHLDSKTDTFVLKPCGRLQIKTNEPIFIHLAYRSILFRLTSEQYRIVGDRLICEYPVEARALNARPGGPRYALPFNSDISLTIKKVEYRQWEKHELEVRIVDVSERGFGILISKSNRDFLTQFDRFWIKAIDHRALRHPIAGFVPYVAPRGYYQSVGDVRVGLSLAAPIAEETFQYLKKRASRILLA